MKASLMDDISVPCVGLFSFCIDFLLRAIALLVRIQLYYTAS